MALVMTGKTATRNAISTTLRKPGPLQMMTSGAMATIGTVCRKIA